MPTSSDVCSMLRPEGGYLAYGDDYAGIQFLECEPFSEQEYDIGLATYDSWKAAKEAETAQARAEGEATLKALGLTDEQLRALGL